MEVKAAVAFGAGEPLKIWKAFEELESLAISLNQNGSH